MKDKKFIISIATLMLGQAFLYWFLKLFQTNPNYLYFLIDNKIPFIKEFIYIYNIFYPFIFLSFYYLYKKDKLTYFKGIISGIIGYLICDTIFLLYPTIMNRPIITDINNFTDLVIKITYFLDEPALNCFPSVHCLFCFQVIFSYLSSNIYRKKKGIIIIISSLIIISTVLVKQHYLFDMIGALIICIIANIITIKFNLHDKIKRKINW